MSIDTASDVLAPRLPLPVRGVQTTFVQAKALWELPLRALKLVHVMLSYTPVYPFCDTITFSRQKAADLLGVSTRSVSRYLNDLEEAELVERLPQRQKNGVWDCTTVRWTKKAQEKYFHAWPGQERERLGKDKKILESNKEISDSNIPPKTPPERDFHRGTDVSHISGFSKNKEDNKTADAASSQHTSSVSTELKRLMPATPHDLIRPALSLGLNRVQVATLMKNCKLSGQRLQDLFTLYADTLTSRRITGRQALGWLLAVIKRGYDTAWLVAQQRLDARRAAKHVKNRRLLDRIGQALAVRPVVLPDGAVLEEICGGMAVVRYAGGSLSSCPVDRLARFLSRHHVHWTIDLLRNRHPVPAVAPLFPTTAFPGDLTGSGRSASPLKRYFTELKALLKKQSVGFVPGSDMLPTVG